eukprot:GHVT01069748.1.p1 GENE.GHVT01069748.1~~GHVT01069748.1.p1  ORF type:complete len:247 (+),score=30.54 GHVT01069748.1:116-856(+)
MVYALLIHSTTSTRDVYFAIFYTPEGNDERRKPRQQMIIQRVLQEQAALQAALGATLSHHGAEKEGILTDRGMHTASGLSSASVASSTPPLGSASKRQPQASEGAQRLLPSTFISEQHLLLWRIVGRVCYTLVVDACENPLLASSFLILLGAFSRALLAPAGGTTDVAVNKAMQPDYEQEALMFATRPDVILAILHFLLPGGPPYGGNRTVHRPKGPADATSLQRQRHMVTNIPSRPARLQIETYS